MEHYLPHELLCSDSVQPEQMAYPGTWYPGRGRRSVAPPSLFLLWGDRTGTNINSISFDVADGHHRRWTSTPFCRGMRKISRSSWFGWRGNEAQGSACTQTCLYTYSRNGTNDHEQPRSVPLVPMLFAPLKSAMLSYLPHRYNTRYCCCCGVCSLQQY